MKRNAALLIPVALLSAVLLSSCGGLFMSDQGRDLVGLWEGDSLDGYSTSYYDFRDDGSLYETENSDLWTFYNYWPVPFMPVYFDYSASEGSLTISQYAGLVKFEFETNSAFSDNVLELTVKNSSDLNALEPGDTLILNRVIDYTPADSAARAFLEEYADEN